MKTLEEFGVVKTSYTSSISIFMTKKQIGKKIVESFLDVKFKGCVIFIKENQHRQTNGFFLNEKKYYLCSTLILYYWERPDSFKVAFNNDFLKEIEKWVPIRGKKQFFRDWLFEKKFPDFEYKKLLEKKFSFYG